LRQIKHPVPVVFRMMQAVHLLVDADRLPATELKHGMKRDRLLDRGKTQLGEITWASVMSSFESEEFKHRLKRLSAEYLGQFPEVLMKVRDEFLNGPDKVDQKKLLRASKAAFNLYTWASALVMHACVYAGIPHEPGQRPRPKSVPVKASPPGSPREPRGRKSIFNRGLHQTNPLKRTTLFADLTSDEDNMEEKYDDDFSWLPDTDTYLSPPTKLIVPKKSIHLKTVQDAWVHNCWWLFQADEGDKGEKRAKKMKDKGDWQALVSEVRAENEEHERLTGESPTPRRRNGTPRRGDSMKSHTEMFLGGSNEPKPITDFTGKSGWVWREFHPSPKVDSFYDEALFSSRGSGPCPATMSPQSRTASPIKEIRRGVLPRRDAEVLEPAGAGAFSDSLYTAWHRGETWAATEAWACQYDAPRDVRQMSY